MRIGFVAIYSWRPHVEHLYFLAKLAQKAGHQAYFLSCDGDLPACYTRELRGRAAWRECLQCRAGGIRSFAGRRVDGIGELLRARHSAESTTVSPEWASSSASTLGRFESDADFSSEEFQQTASRLVPAVERSYAAACEWIRKNELDAVCVFNARMDATRAIAEAARAANIRFVSLERTWFGDGLQLLPDENCLGLRSVHSLVQQWRERTLTWQQASLAASQIAGRFLRANVKEWRAYNLNARAIEWPGGDVRRKILLLPSSYNEVRGHTDWVPEWPEPTAAYDRLLAHLSLQPGEVVLRCHPNWAERIGKHDGAHSERYYTDWAKRRGVPCISSGDTASTMNLIEQCDAIVVASGSAGLEAGILGKQVISVAPSLYQEAGFRDSAYNASELQSLRLHMELDPERRKRLSRHSARQTLRFCYTMVFRIPQYTRFVRAETTTKYWYDLNADPQRLIDLLRTGVLQADDDTSAETADGENEILGMIERGQWAALHVQPPAIGANFARIKRRRMRRYIDWIADRKSVGDR